VERDALQRTLENSRWNVSHAARLLGISRDALRYRIEKYALAVPD
jgi:transcriptional regulator of acetoin/glycerol metabolism